MFCSYLKVYYRAQCFDRRLFIKMRILVLPSLLLSSLASAVPSTSWAPGLWAQKNYLDPRTAPEVRGVLFTAGWHGLQPTRDTWDWDSFDKQLRDVAELGLGIGLRFYTGAAAPHWLYEAGVPEVKLEGNEEDSYPYYPDLIYKEYYYRLDI